jgi:DNA primase
MAAQFIDFALLKESVSMRQVVQMLDLRMKGSDQLRSACPVCRSGGDRALAVNLTKQSFYCFAKGQGGDQIGLVAHIRDSGQREAAQEIADHFRVGQPDDRPSRPAETARTSEGGLQPLDYLEHAHDAVQTLGFEPEIAEQLGIGFAGKGVMRGLVVVPVRLEDGTLVGYLGIQDAKLPPSWKLPTSNVVKLKKPA